MTLSALRLKTIPRQFKFDLDFGYKLALTYVKQMLSILKEMINHASETSCQIQEQRGFLKYVCMSGTSTYNKCHNSEETFYLVSSSS